MLHSLPLLFVPSHHHHNHLSLSPQDCARVCGSTFKPGEYTSNAREATGSSDPLQGGHQVGMVVVLCVCACVLCEYRHSGYYGASAEGVADLCCK